LQILTAFSSVVEEKAPKTVPAQPDHMKKDHCPALTPEQRRRPIIMKTRTVIVTLSTVLLTASAARADGGGFAIAGRAGTLGLGGEASVNIFQDLNFRAGFSVFSFDYAGSINEIDYKFKADLRTLPLMLDWYPFHDAFHLTGGIILNDSGIDLQGKSSTSVTIGDQTYSAEQAGTLNGNIDFNRVAPYLGIGWGNPFNNSSRLGLLCDLGVAYSGSPDVSLRATGTYANDPTFQSNLAKERQDLQDKANRYKFYPVLSVSLYFRF
jgi:hypothetical protein